MRFTALLIAAVLVCITLAPGPVNYSAASDATPAVRTLDICHTSSGGMNFDLPYLLSHSAVPMPLQLSGVQPLPGGRFKPILLVFTDERPPQSNL